MDGWTIPLGVGIRAERDAVHAANKKSRPIHGRLWEQCLGYCTSLATFRICSTVMALSSPPTELANAAAFLMSLTAT